MSDETPCTCALSQVVSLTPELKEALVEHYGEEATVIYRKGARHISRADRVIQGAYGEFERTRFRGLTLEEIKHLLSRH